MIVESQIPLTENAVYMRMVVSSYTKTNDKISITVAATDMLETFRSQLNKRNHFLYEREDELEYCIAFIESVAPNGKAIISVTDDIYADDFFDGMILEPIYQLDPLVLEGFLLTKEV